MKHLQNHLMAHTQSELFQNEPIKYKYLSMNFQCHLTYLQTHFISSAEENLKIPLSTLTLRDLSIEETLANSSRVLSIVLIDSELEVVKFFSTSYTTSPKSPVVV